MVFRGMGFKKKSIESSPMQAPKVETVSAGESEHSAKRSLLKEERRRRGRASTLLASEAERLNGGNGRREEADARVMGMDEVADDLLRLYRGLKTERDGFGGTGRFALWFLIPHKVDDFSARPSDFVGRIYVF